MFGIRKFTEPEPTAFDDEHKKLREAKDDIDECIKKGKPVDDAAMRTLVFGMYDAMHKYIHEIRVSNWTIRKHEHECQNYKRIMLIMCAGAFLFIGIALAPKFMENVGALLEKFLL